MHKGFVVTALISVAVIILMPNEAMGLVVAIVGGLVVTEIERLTRKRGDRR
jgi:hypothetical protein